MYAFIPSLGGQEFLLLLLLGVLLFGRKLPEIGRSLGKTVVEFKKGVKGLEEEVNNDSPVSRAPVDPEPVRPPTRITTAAPKFSDAPQNDVPPRV